jgi:hypothetical protein
MSNLLPRDVKRTIILEYRIRIASLWCLVLAAAFVIGTFLFGPAVVAVVSESRAVMSEMQANAESANEEYAESLASIDRANLIAARLSRDTVTFSVTDAMREVDKELGSGVSFEGMSFMRAEDGTPRIEVSGTAATREILAQLVERLKANPYFLDATVPFGQLAQATNAPFTITLTVRPVKK